MEGMPIIAAKTEMIILIEKLSKYVSTGTHVNINQELVKYCFEGMRREQLWVSSVKQLKI